MPLANVGAGTFSGTTCHTLAGNPLKNDSLAPFFCDMNAIPAERRKQHITVTKEVFGAIQALRELPNGYAFQLADTPGVLLKAAEFIDTERLCCRFRSQVRLDRYPRWANSKANSSGNLSRKRICNRTAEGTARAARITPRILRVKCMNCLACELSKKGGRGMWSSATRCKKCSGLCSCGSIKPAPPQEISRKRAVTGE